MKLATLVSHPIQYYSPWFKFIAEKTNLENKVFYLWNYGVVNTYDRDFQKCILWNVPLLEGYSFEILDNISNHPGTHSFYGLNNPHLVEKLISFKPQAILMFGYLSFSHFNVLFCDRLKSIPKILRGDSHRLFYKNTVFDKLKTITIRNIFKAFRAGLFVGEANKNYFIRNGFRESELFFSPHAIDSGRFYPDNLRRQKTRKEWNLTDKEKLILFSGKFETKKCPVDLAKVFIQNKNKNFRLLYVGSGILEKEIRKIAFKDNRITILGFVDQSLMADVYRAADFVVLPSYGADETWGFSLHEALSCGTAVIASSHVGCASDLIKDGYNGFIFPAGDWTALKNIFDHLESKPYSYDQLGKRGLQIVRNYNYELATRGLVSALEYLIYEK